MTQVPPEVNAYPVAEQKEIAVVVPPPGSTTVSSESAVSIPAGDNDILMGQQEKVGAKCCGCFCDYRRALIVVVIIGIILSVINLIMTLNAISDASSTVSSYIPDDHHMMENEIQDTLDDGARGVVITTILGILASLCALIGAIWFNIWLVLVNVISLAVNFILAIRFSYSPLQIMISTVCTALFLYPHIGFIMEVKKGIMTRETYPREEYSCCCVTARV